MSNTLNMKILIVDDDKEFLEEVREMLTQSGYDITVVSDGVTALEMITKINPRVVLLDLKMSPKSGFQIASELRYLLGGRHGIHIIAMTGFFTEKEHHLLMKVCGIRTCILKPIKPLDLIAKIELIMEESNQESAVPFFRLN